MIWYGGSVADGAWTSYNNIMKCNARYRKMILRHIIFIFPQAEIGLISSEISLNSTAIFLKKRYGRFVDLGQNVMKMLICFSPLNPGIEEPKVTFWVHPQTWNLKHYLEHFPLMSICWEVTAWKMHFLEPKDMETSRKHFFSWFVGVEQPNWNGDFEGFLQAISFSGVEYIQMLNVWYIYP